MKIAKISVLIFLVSLLSGCDNILDDILCDTFNDCDNDVIVAQKKTKTREIEHLDTNKQIITDQIVTKTVFNKGDSIDDYDVYDNDNIIIIYPNYWKVIEKYSGADVVFLSPLIDEDDKFSENVNIIIQDASGLSWTTEEYTVFSRHEIVNNHQNGIVLESEDTVLGDLEGHHLLYIYREGSLVFKSSAYYTIVDEKVHLITYTAEEKEYERYIDDVEKMVKSFRVIE